MTTDGALLALIIDDDDAIRCLAAWASIERPLGEIEDGKLVDRIAEIAAVSAGRARSCLSRLRAARVLVDGGITEMADKMLQTFVQRRLNGTHRGRR